MNAEALSRSLSFLPDSMIGEAIHSRAKKRIHFTPWLRAVVCIAVVLGLLFGISFPWLSGEKYITAPSVLAVKAYAFENEWKPSEHILKEGVTAYDHGWLQDYSFEINCVPGFPITFSFSKDREKYQNLVLDISVEKGHFVEGFKDIDSNGEFQGREGSTTARKQISSILDRTIYWRYWEVDPETGKATTSWETVLTDVYIDVVLRDGDNIIGYAVIKLENTDLSRYEMYLLKSVYYPKILDNYQKVTEEYIQDQIETVKMNCR